MEPDVHHYRRCTGRANDRKDVLALHHCMGHIGVSLPDLDPVLACDAKVERDCRRSSASTFPRKNGRVLSQLGSGVNPAAGWPYRPPGGALAFGAGLA
jgi:hypothetical protein